MGSLVDIAILAWRKRRGEHSAGLFFLNYGSSIIGGAGEACGIVRGNFSLVKEPITKQPYPSIMMLKAWII